MKACSVQFNALDFTDVNIALNPQATSIQKPKLKKRDNLITYPLITTIIRQKRPYSIISLHVYQKRILRKIIYFSLNHFHYI